jgi:hypothetical protein
MKRGKKESEQLAERASPLTCKQMGERKRKKHEGKGRKGRI